jgi:thioredoxin reductase/ferredoxin
MLDHMTSVIMALAMFIVVFRIMGREKHHKTAKKILKKTVAAMLHEPLTLHPEIDPSICAGCGACTKVCPEGDILKLINHKAVLVAPSKCVGHGECERACPLNAIKLVFGTKTRGMDIPRLTSNYETNVSGLYIAGELGGMGLIRNAVRQGVYAAQHAIKKMANIGPAVDYDLMIVGAGPAGMAAALSAIAGKTKYILIEQNSFGGTIYNFPRQKVVMSYSLDLPIVGQMKFASNKVSKEELLAYWQEVKKKTGMKVTEGVRFDGLEKKGDIFHVKTTQGEIKARKVIMCLGVRGSPRKLGVPGEEKAKVTYNLIDPEQYQGKTILVVGGGNAGVEAAQMLGDPKWKNKTILLVRGSNFDRCNEDNIKRINAMKGRGHVEIWFSSHILKIDDKEAEVSRDGKSMRLPNDFVFIFAGAEMPHKFLMSLGIEIDKKFGEGLRSG